jgi:hypothetical protein
LTLLNNEIAIPFGAFGAGREGVEQLDVLADEIDGSIVAAEPEHSAATSAALPPRTRAGRIVIAVAAAHEGTLAAVDEMVNGLLDHLADSVATTRDQGQANEHHAHEHHDREHHDREHHAHEHHDREHHDPGDLVHWAQVDAARGRLATALGVLVCLHHLGFSPRTYVVTVEAPARLLGLLVSAAEVMPAVTRSALLTAEGPTTTEPEGSVVTLAAVRHAHRVGGRAEVFPGQEWLTEDTPVSDVVGRTAIDEVRSTQGPIASGAVLRAFGFVRPSYADGALVLTVGHDDPRVVTPWEVRYCRPCCG